MVEGFQTFEGPDWGSACNIVGGVPAGQEARAAVTTQSAKLHG